jgi:hypothetical protein
LLHAALWNYTPSVQNLLDFYSLAPDQRDEVLIRKIAEAHRWHFARNEAYRLTISARGVSADTDIDAERLPLLLRVSAITYKSYIEQIATPFPQQEPALFMDWMRSFASVSLPRDKKGRLKRRYPNMEALFLVLERLFSDQGLEIVTSSGTSGKATIILRNADSIRMATAAYFAAIAHAWEIGPGCHLVFVMPEDTRVAMARIARMATRELDWGKENHIAYTMPFKATPDLIRIRTGRTFRNGLSGLLERRILNPFMAWANGSLGESRYVRETLRALQELPPPERPVLLLGGLVQLDAVARAVPPHDPIVLPQGSRVATGGGLKGEYPDTPSRIRSRLRKAFVAPGGQPLPVSDIYGMAEAHWAAFECREGNYHLPPWVYYAVTDDDDRIANGSDVTGLLAFWDPVAGGRVYPPFFQTADRVRLINGNGHYDHAKTCTCGDGTAYLARDSIQRVDLIEEAGCGASI